MTHSRAGIERAARKLAALDVAITPRRMARELDRIAAVPGPSGPITDTERRKLVGSLRQYLRPAARPAQEFVRDSVLPSDAETRIVIAFQLRHLLEINAHALTEDLVAAIESAVERVVSVVVLTGYV